MRNWLIWPTENSSCQTALFYSMLAVFLSWIIVLFYALNSGWALVRFLKIIPRSAIITAFLGFIPILLFAAVWAFFAPIDALFFAGFSLLQLLLFAVQRRSFLRYIRRQITGFFAWETAFKCWFFALSALLVYAASGTGMLPDNETYYIQTVKWLNEAGYVAGLANLHPFLAQQSGWHLLQAVFSFSFLEIDFNDISAFALWLFGAFSIQRLRAFSITKSQPDLTLGVMGGFLPMLLFFAAVPSPDMAVIILSALLFWRFLNDETASSAIFSELLLLAALACFIKVTAGFLVFIPLYYAYKNPRVLVWRPMLISVFLFGVFAVKNAVISGYPLFPLTALRIDAVHSVPQAISSYFFGTNGHLVYGLSPQDFKQASFFDLIKRWLSQPSPDKWLNMHAVCAAVFFIVFSLFKPKWRWCALLFVFQLAVLIWSGPHFRFTLHWSLFATAALATVWFARFPKTVPAFLYLALFTAMGAQYYIDNQPSERAISVTSRLFIPHENSKLRLEVHQAKRGNLRYNAPQNTDLFWLTSDTPLPCVSGEQLEYFEKYFGYIPQRTARGFKSQSVTEIPDNP